MVRKTNVQAVRSMMEYSDFGALAQAFIIEAISRYADEVSESTPEDYGSFTLVSPESWIGVAREIRKKMNAHLGEE